MNLYYLITAFIIFCGINNQKLAWAETRTSVETTKRIESHFGNEKFNQKTKEKGKTWLKKSKKIYIDNCGNESNLDCYKSYLASGGEITEAKIKFGIGACVVDVKMACKWFSLLTNMGHIKDKKLSKYLSTRMCLYGSLINCLNTFDKNFANPSSKEKLKFLCDENLAKACFYHSMETKDESQKKIFLRKACALESIFCH